MTEVYVVYYDYGYEGCSEPKAVYSNNDAAIAAVEKDKDCRMMILTLDEDEKE